MALTFGTLLSSQGTDAQSLRPFRAIIPGGLDHITPCTARCHTRRADHAAPGSPDPVSLGATKKLPAHQTAVKPTDPHPAPSSPRRNRSHDKAPGHMPGTP